MGQKVSPIGLRFGINREWISRWNSPDNKTTAKWLVEDEKVRNFLVKNYKRAGVEHAEIERVISANGILIFTLIVYVAQPGLILGKDADTTKLEKELHYIVGKKTKINIFVKQVANTGLSARLIAREIASAIENRVPFRNAQKLGIKKVMVAGAKGVKTRVSGRLAGAEIARDEGYSEGVVPLATLRANIDYALELAKTTYGIIGVKVWINRGLFFGKGFIPEPVAPERKPFIPGEHQRKPFKDRESRDYKKVVKSA